MKRAGIVFALLALFGSLAGCGIRPTAVLTGGQAPIGVAPGPTLYFLVNGQLAPVPRVTGHLGTPSAALDLLVGGPLDTERAQGVTTALPPISAVAGATVDLDQATFDIYLPIDVRTLHSSALDQIVCTVIGVEGQSGAARPGLAAVLRGTTGALKSTYCPLFKD